MGSRYKSKNTFLEIFSGFPVVEVVIVLIVFLVVLGILLVPKDIAYKISILPFISVFR